MKTPKQLFEELFQCHTEEEVDTYISSYPGIFHQANWYPLGGNENNYGVIENQQASPIAGIRPTKYIFHKRGIVLNFAS